MPNKSVSIHYFCHSFIPLVPLHFPVVQPSSLSVSLPLRNFYYTRKYGRSRKETETDVS